MKLGIIGSGMIVEAFLPQLITISDLEITVLLGTRRSGEKIRKLCEEYRITLGVTDFDEFLAAGPKIAYIAVPNHLHYDYCRRCLEAGLHVIVEKPMTAAYDQAQKLAALAEDKHRMLFEAVTTPYLNAFARIVGWLPRIGRIRLVQSQYSQYSSRYNAFRRGEVLPAFDPAKAGGALMDLNVYNLHMLVNLFGAPESFQYHANIIRGIDTSGVLTLQYPDFTAVCVAAKDSRGLTGTFLQGEDGWIRTDFGPNVIGNVTLELNDGTKENFTMEDPRKRVIPEFEEFLRCIREDDEESCHRAMEKSLTVSRICCEALWQAGITFS